jgi:hypothetical protein
MRSKLVQVDDSTASTNPEDERTTRLLSHTAGASASHDHGQSRLERELSTATTEHFCVHIPPPHAVEIESTLPLTSPTIQEEERVWNEEPIAGEYCPARRDSERRLTFPLPAVKLDNEGDAQEQTESGLEEDKSRCDKDIACRCPSVKLILCWTTEKSDDH